MDPARSVIDDGAIAVRGERILDIGPRERSEIATVPSSDFGQGHDHSSGTHQYPQPRPMTLFRGIADDMKWTCGWTSTSFLWKRKT